MEGVKISDFPVGSAPTGSEEVPMVQAGVTVRIPLVDLLLVGPPGPPGPPGPSGISTVDVTITSSDALHVPLTVRGFVGQAVNLQEWVNSAGTLLLAVDANGGLNCPQVYTLAGSINFGSFNNNGVVNIGIFNGTASVSQRVDFYARNALRARMGWNGAWFVGGSVDCVPITSRAVAAQTANLHEWADSAGAVMSSVGPKGSFSPATLADADAPNNSIYFSSTAGALVYKSSAGVVKTFTLV